MDFNGRRRGPSSGASSIPKAVGIGVAVGLLLSVALFAHNRQIDDLKFQLESQLNDHVQTANKERHMRELAEQLSTEADAERSNIQNKLKDRDGAVLAANKEAADAQKLVKEAEGQLATVQEKLKELESKKPDEEKEKILQKELEDLRTRLKDAESEVNAAKSRSQGAKLSSGRHTVWHPSAERDSKDPDLAVMLKKVAINNEVMVAVCNRNLAQPGQALDVWARNVNRANISNAIVVALDEETEDFCKAVNMKFIRMPPLVKEGVIDPSGNHAVSAMKFTYLQRFLKLGYSVFLTDVDILFFQDPFKHIYRDSDVEGMSDGWTNETAYGYNDVFDDPAMGWARYAHSMRIFCMNSGLFFMRPTEASLDLLERTVAEVDRTKGWDQAVFNEVLWFPSANERQEVGATKRILCRYKFMNSKTLFKEVRFQPGLLNTPPVSLHVNYHANKLERMLAAEKWYIDGDSTELMRMEINS